jgi:very-short-patch-repair endonuclease
VEVERGFAAPYAIDIGLRELCFGAEYDGEEFHGPEREDHDADRRAWLERERGWILVVARKQHIQGPTQEIHVQLRRAYEQALRRARR